MHIYVYTKYINTYIYIYISTYSYPGKGFGFFWVARGPDPGSPCPGGPGTRVPSTGPGVPAISGATMSDKSRYDRPLNRMIASKPPQNRHLHPDLAVSWTPK